ncbi:hypothetical protein ASZ90_014784 [hydrocarbon metagenome]|uniref:Uncharacterized protein n=1 Tax=hydrocarbon metagenome TaxID=938273 RepID=A0A0W8F549_9ZZZZ
MDPWWFHPAAERFIRGDDVQAPRAGSRAHGLPTGERVEHMQPERTLPGSSNQGVSDALHPHR